MPVRVGESVALWHCRAPMTMRPRRHRGAHLPRGGGRTIQLWFAWVPLINNGQSVSGQAIANQSMANQSSVQIFSGTNRWSITRQSINQWQRCGDFGDCGGVAITSPTCASRLGNLLAVAQHITFVICSYTMEVMCWLLPQTYLGDLRKSPR